MAGRIALVGIGPGDPRQMTLAAHEAITAAEVIIGYRPYLELIAESIGDQQQRIVSGMTEELERCRAALEQARAGQRVALISSGDVGVFGMAAPLFELLFAEGWRPGADIEVTVVPGITAASSCAAQLGAPLSHDFCTISLSDQLTPWAVIAERLDAAARADFVIALYNPRSRRRRAHILKAREILLRHRPAETPVAIVESAYRDGERSELCTLADFTDVEISMLSTVIIGNRSTRVRDGLMLTPRGYERKYALADGRVRPGERAGWALGEGGDLETFEHGPRLVPVANAAGSGGAGATGASPNHGTVEPIGAGVDCTDVEQGPADAGAEAALACVQETDREAHSGAGAVRDCPALFLSATSSGQGKTTLAAALARHHHRAGRRVRVFKIGPDFLDPMILARASGAEVERLDLWMVGEPACRRLLYEAAGEADLILVEGAMGLFDGTPSGADLAERFGLPAAVLIDARGMGQTFGALALGLAQYRPGLRLAGVIANRVGSERHVEMISDGMPSEVPFLGALPRLDEAVLPSRHLGLVQAAEIADLEQRLDAAAARLAGTALVELPPPVAFQAPAPGFEPEPDTERMSALTPRRAPEPAPELAPALRPKPAPLLVGRRIAVAHDAAFSFLYAANLRLLRSLGAELSLFSPLRDSAVAADAIYLPGGYPELHLETLAANQAMQRSLRDHVDAGKPLYAECGGMLSLLETLTDKEGRSGCLAGLLPGHGRLQPRLAGLGMQSLATPAGALRGHSFHHSTMETPLTPSTYGIRQRDGGRGEPVYRHGSLTASYLHLYFPSAPAAAAALFIDESRL
jgi:cobyrinic acid a,c-diamide synthase